MNLLKQGKSPEEIAQALNEEYLDLPDSVERDVIDFIAHLKTFRLI